MTYLLDTNILLIYLRDNATRQWIDQQFAPLAEGNIPVISVVSVGEVRSIALRNNWSKEKQQKLVELMNLLVIADINSEDVIERYAEIDATSQGKLKGNPLDISARIMSKNDLWIAATASITKARLLTTDNDFNHLDGIFIELVKIALVVT